MNTDEYDTVPDDCDRDDDNDLIDDDDDSCPTPSTPGPRPRLRSWPDDASLPSDLRGNFCDEDDDDDECVDRTECRFDGYTPDDPDQPCGSYACVNGQCRTAERPGDFDNESLLCGWVIRNRHAPLISQCEAMGPYCVGGACVGPHLHLGSHGGRAPPVPVRRPEQLESLALRRTRPARRHRGALEGGGTGSPMGMYTLERLHEGA